MHDLLHGRAKSSRAETGFHGMIYEESERVVGEPQLYVIEAEKMDIFLKDGIG